MEGLETSSSGFQIWLDYQRHLVSLENKLANKVLLWLRPNGQNFLLHNQENIHFIYPEVRNNYV